MELLKVIKEKAKKNNKRIILPEGTEERTLKAADILIKEKIANIILLGKREDIESSAGKLGLKNIKNATIIDPVSHPGKL